MNPASHSGINYARLLRTLGEQTQSTRPEWLHTKARVYSPEHGIGEVTLLLGGILKVTYDRELELVEYRNWKTAVADGVIQPAKDTFISDVDEESFEQIPVPLHEKLAREWASLLHHIEVLPLKASNTVEIPSDLPASLQAALQGLGFDALYTHQLEALEAYRRGETTYLCTETSSGKTLAFQLCITESAINDRGTALMLFPTNALIEDQAQSIETLIDRVNGEGGSSLRAIKLVGGMTIKNREALFRSCPDFILINPEVLNHQIGKTRYWQYEQWKTFLQRLQTIVIDEAHYSTGGFGANVANLIRRVRVAVKRVGGNPHGIKFILCSATVRNPEVLARLLTQQPDDVPMRIIQQSGAGNPGRTILCFKSNVGRTGTVCKIAYSLVESGLTSLLFFNSREAAKSLLSRVQKEMKRNQSQHGVREIALFHSSVRADRKREIVSGLESGAIKQVFSTSALEAGIDIPQVEVSVVLGFPGISAFRQRSGRSGRGDTPGLTLFIPVPERSLDYYYANHPDELVHGDVEAAMLNPDYPLRLSQHLLACAQESMLHPNELGAFFGPLAETVAGELLDQGLINCLAVYLSASGRPQDAIQMRGSDYSQVDLVDQGTGRSMERLNRPYAIREVYTGAIYTLQSEDGSMNQYRCQGLDLEQQQALLIPIVPASNFSTQPEGRLEIQPEQIMKSVAIELTAGELQGVLTFNLFWGSVSELTTGFSEYLTKTQLSCSNSGCMMSGQVLDKNQQTCSTCGSALGIGKVERKLIRSTDFEQPYEQKTEGPLLILDCDQKLQEQIQARISDQKAQIQERYPQKIPKRYEELFKCSPISLALHTLSHQLMMAMPMQVRYSIGDLRDVELTGEPEESPQWVIFDAGSGGNGASEYIAENVRSLAKGALAMSECSCESSACPQCLTIQKCPENNQGLHRPIGVDLLTAILGSNNLQDSGDEVPQIT